MDEIKTPEFATKAELFEFLVKNKETLIAQKKAQLKNADSICLHPSIVNEKGCAEKANEPFTPSSDEFKVRVVINTTNILDSHMDVHIPGIWNKSLKENKMIMHLQEHKMGFEYIISNGKDLKAFAKNYDWSEIGFGFEGKTQALVFDSNVKKKRNEFMFGQYSDGYVLNHSVGMQYIKLVMCVNDEGYGAEYEAWEKYYPQIVNPDVADKKGYFWAVTEAKVIEGSAVPIGSNQATPTLENNMNKIEPSNEDTQQDTEPSEDTQRMRKFYINLNKNI